LNDGLALTLLLGRSLIVSNQRRFSCLEIQTRTQLTKDIHRPRQVFGGEFRLRQRISATQIVIRAGDAVSIAEQIEDRHAAAEMLRCEWRVRLREGQQTPKPLGLACQHHVGG